VQRTAHPTKGRHCMQRYSSSRCQPLELRFLAGRLAKFGLEGDQPQSQANAGKKHQVRVERCRKRAMSSQSGSVTGPIWPREAAP
jgi:hypothetical protein